jgi:hypothetical protein
MQDHRLRPWEITKLTIPQAGLYLGSEEPQKQSLHESHMEAWRKRTQIFNLMCERTRLTPRQLVEQPEADLLATYSSCAQGIAKQTTVEIDQLRMRLHEYIADKDEGRA